MCEEKITQAIWLITQAMLAKTLWVWTECFTLHPRYICALLTQLNADELDWEKEDCCLTSWLWAILTLKEILILELPNAG